MAWELAISAIIMGTAFLLIYLSGILNKEHGALKLLFIGVSLFVILIALNMNTSIIEANNSTLQDTTITSFISSTNSAYRSMMWVIIFTLAYFFIYLLYIAIMAMKKGVR